MKCRAKGCKKEIPKKGKGVTGPIRTKFCSKKCSVAENMRIFRTRESFFKNLCTQKGADRENLSPQYLEELFEAQSGRCALSGVPMTRLRGQGRVETNISIDRIDPVGEYEPGNIRLVCFIVNIMRQRMTDEHLRWWCEQIVGN